MQHGAYNLQLISACAERVWPRETNLEWETKNGTPIFELQTTFYRNIQHSHSLGYVT